MLALVYVRSMRCTLTELDRINYARWIPVHLTRGTWLNYPQKHPDVTSKFRTGSFTAQKTKKVVYTIATRHMNRTTLASKEMAEQLASLTMVAGPEVARAIEEFQDGNEHWGKRVDTRHQYQTQSVQISFAKDVCSLFSLATLLRKRVWIWLSEKQRKWHTLVRLRVYGMLIGLANSSSRLSPGMPGGKNRAYL